MTDPSPAILAEDLDLADETVEVARRYAVALLAAAQNEDQVDRVLDELDEIRRDVLLTYPRFAQILASSRVTAVAKDRILVELFENRASNFVVRFLRVLNRHERLGVLSLVAREARDIWDRRNKRVPVQIRSAVPLDQTRMQALGERLLAVLGATPIFKFSTDPDLIGGLIVQVGDNRYDASVKTRLAQLRQRLIEGKTHEIQSRRDQFSNPA
jgi:F-type H+-transporting ATPase subunit delta